MGVKMQNAMLVRERCFDCGYIHEEFISPKALTAMFRHRKFSHRITRFPKCPDCKKPVQLLSFEEVKYMKGVSKNGN